MRIRLLALAIVSALLFMPTIVARAADTNTGNLTGTVRTVAGAPVAEAHVSVTGPTTKAATTDAAGTFTMNALPAGLYRIDVAKGGYVAASITDVAIFNGATQPITVTLERADLSSLRTIASVTTSARSSINTGAAVMSIASHADFANLAVPQINDVAQRIPGVVIQHGSSSPNTTIDLAGVQGYETQVLLDGHPLSAGRYGVWFSQFFNSFMVQNLETEIGPGNTTPFAGTAVGGTANIVTPGFTNKPTYELTTGFDSFSGQYTNLLDTDRVGKFSYVFAAGYDGDNRKYYDTYGCVIDPSNKATWNTPGATGVIQFCGDLGGPQFSKGEIVKGRWDFSPTTSFDVEYVGSQGGYMPQGSSYGLYTGPITIVPCITVGANKQCNNPTFNGYVGQTINGYFFYPGSNVYNNQPFFSGQFRTAFGPDTLLVRPYAGNITRIIDGSHEDDFANFFIPAGQAASSCTGPPNYGSLGPVVNGLRECYNENFSVLESDKLKGGTLSYIHPLSSSAQITGTYDYHSDETFAYYNDPGNVAVPDTTARFNTLSLTGEDAILPSLTLKAGLYDTIWNLAGTQAGPIVSGKVTTVGLTRTVSRLDPHVALILQPAGGSSVRLSFGTSTTFPYASQVSGNAVLQKASGTGGSTNTLVTKNPAQISDVFETLVFAPSPANPNYQLVNEPVNAAHLSSLLGMVTLRHEPLRGFGYYLTAAANRSIPSGIPITSIGFTVPANGVQQCSDGGSTVCVPYLKGYARISYTTNDGSYIGLGADYEGKNNTYFQPPFAIYDLTLRRPIASFLDAQVSVANLLNTNTAEGLVTPNAGTPMVGENGAGQYGNYTGSVPFPFIPVQPRDVRVQFHYHVGR
jgi:hypothetical protein